MRFCGIKRRGHSRRCRNAFHLRGFAFIAPGNQDESKQRFHRWGRGAKTPLHLPGNEGRKLGRAAQLNPGGAQSGEHTPQPSHDGSRGLRNLPGSGSASQLCAEQPPRAEPGRASSGLYIIPVPSARRGQGIPMTQGSGGSSESTRTISQQGDVPRSPWLIFGGTKLFLSQFLGRAGKCGILGEKYPIIPLRFPIAASGAPRAAEKGP